MFIDLYRLIDDLRIYNSVEAHDEVYIITLINRSFKLASTIFKGDRLLKLLYGIL
jgi:hypothetical protein